MGDVGKVLEELYYNPKNPSSFSSVNKLYKAAKVLIPHISLKDIKNWLANQDVYTLYRKRVKTFSRLPTLSEYVDKIWQADIMDMSYFAKFNKNVKYLLVAIDVLSRYAFAQPLKSKGSGDVIAAFSKIFKSGRKPKKLQTDQGKEFVNHRFKKFMNEKRIIHYTTTDDSVKCAIVERFNRTLREKIYKFLGHKKDLKYIGKLQDFLTAYNNSIHRMIKEAPSRVNDLNAEKVYLEILNHIKPKKVNTFTSGELVRIQRSKGAFEKGATPNFTPEVFQIDRVLDKGSHTVFKLKDLSGEPITSIFYPSELSLVKTQ